MAVASKSGKVIFHVKDLPEYQKLKSAEYIPFNLEEDPPAENEFYTDKGAGVDGPALFSTRGTRHEKRPAPDAINPATAETNLLSDETRHAIKVIAARFRKDFALECKAIDESSVSLPATSNLILIGDP